MTTNAIRNVLVLLSGGQDSTTCLWWAKDTYPDAAIHALTVSYGQRHAAEVGVAAEISRLAGCATHDFAYVKGLGTESALIEGSDAELRGDGGLPDQHAPGGLPTSFVPGRNMVFLALAAARAVAVGASRIVTGVCQTDYSGYPDCRKTFINAMEAAIAEAMPSGIDDIVIDTPLMRLTKADTVAMMVGFAEKAARWERRAGERVLPSWWQKTAPWVALGKSVTCYKGARPGCGACPACQLRARGFAEAGIVDPGTTYAEPPPGRTLSEADEALRAAGMGMLPSEARPRPRLHVDAIIPPFARDPFDPDRLDNSAGRVVREPVIDDAGEVVGHYLVTTNGEGG